MINLLDASGLATDNVPLTPGIFCKKYFCDLVHPSHLPDSISQASNISVNDIILFKSLPITNTSVAAYIYSNGL